jgi:hypothetical protein
LVRGYAWVGKQPLAALIVFDQQIVERDALRVDLRDALEDKELAPIVHAALDASDLNPRLALLFIANRLSQTSHRVRAVFSPPLRPSHSSLS